MSCDMPWLAWKTLIDLSVVSYSVTRWWSKFEVLYHLYNTVGDVPKFLHSSDLPPATTGKLIRVIDDDPACRKLKIELVDAMELFVKATYAVGRWFLSTACVLEIPMGHFYICI